MPIIKMCSSKTIPEGAQNVTVYDAEKDIVLYETFIGLCLVERERNMYDDSDFYMTVWDETTESPKEIMFATTRGWTYPCYASSVDATPDIVAKWEAWKANKAAELRRASRHEKAIKLIALRNEMRNVAKDNNFDYCRLLRLRHDACFDGYMKLFGKKIRSNFKISLRNQLLLWLRGNSQYSSPFSAKQKLYL